MASFYNDNDPIAARVLESLARENLIAPGQIDARSIKEIQPHEIEEFTQCHFFAGAGLWSVAARLAGWPDDKPLWSASCPCQPFSVAGKGAGIDDPRHLWPDVIRLVSARRPPVIVGEQVAGTAGEDWFDGVRSDLAREGYDARVVVLPSLAVDSPNIRLRQYWVAVADADSCGRDGWQEASQRESIEGTTSQRPHDDVEHATSIRWGEGRPKPVIWSGRATTAGADASGVTQGDAFGARLEGHAGHDGGTIGRQEQDRSVAAPNGSFWSDHEWIVCHDAKARRTKPGIRMLVDGMAGRIHLWRLAGNSINPVLAAEVLRALL